MVKRRIFYIFFLIVSVLVQVLIFDRITLSSVFLVQYYVIFVLLLPFNLNRYSVLFLALLSGLLVDIFNSTPGLHSSAIVFMGYFRNFFLSLYSPRDGYDQNKLPGIQSYGTGWFIRYSFFLILIHNFVIFILEAFSFENFGQTLLKIFASTIATIVFVILGNIIFFKRGK